MTEALTGLNEIRSKTPSIAHGKQDALINQRFPSTSGKEEEENCNFYKSLSIQTWRHNENIRNKESNYAVNSVAVITSMIGTQTKGELSAQDYSAKERFL